MFTIAYKEYPFKIKKEKDIPFIFDSIRNKWIVLTPEEWVRQNFIQYLIEECGVPSTVIALEKQITTFENKRRFDLVIYDTPDQPLLIVECKQQQVKLDDAVLQQVLNYQSVVQCKYLMVTNGDFVAGWELGHPVKPLSSIPTYREMKNMGC